MYFEKGAQGAFKKRGPEKTPGCQEGKSGGAKVLKTLTF
jgi:hypothetical protein